MLAKDYMDTVCCTAVEYVYHCQCYTAVVQFDNYSYLFDDKIVTESSDEHNSYLSGNHSYLFDKQSYLFDEHSYLY